MSRFDVESVKVDWDEDGCFLILDGNWKDSGEASEYRHRLLNPEQAYDAVNRGIGPWLEERDSARLAFLCEHGALNPDHPDWGERLRDAIDLSRKYQRENPS